MISKEEINEVNKNFYIFISSNITTHAFAKSNDYYQMVITNVLTNCKSDDCRKAIFEQEVHIAFSI